MQTAFNATRPTVETASIWVRPRTLTSLRWIAAAAQAVILLAGALIFGLDVPWVGCALSITLLVVANLAIMGAHADNRNMTEREGVLSLTGDVGQLALLLSLTGGLNNPFAMLIVGPVTIAATALGRTSTIVLASVTVVFTTLVAFFHVPLRMQDGQIIAVPQLVEGGFWLSIVLGVVFLSAYARRVSTEIRGMAEALSATRMALAREQKLTDLGGVVAAAAHELGTPLATIKLVSTELIHALAQRPDLQDLHDDARLIREQADRCRDILHSMGRAGKDDLHLRNAPLGDVLREAAEPHAARGKVLLFEIRSQDGGSAAQPVITRRPEIIHGLRNLIENAVDHAHGTVRIEGRWTDASITITITDDGPGYPLNILSRIGEPFIRGRAAVDKPGPVSISGDGMGLGLFIAKTLLERSGAELTFSNLRMPDASDTRQSMSGATVMVVWPRGAIAGVPSEPLGENQVIRG